MTETKAKQRLRGLVCGACIIASPSLAQAQEETRAPGGTRAGVAISSGVEVSSNPFLTEDGSEAASAYISIDPSVFLEDDDRNATVLQGSFRLSQYANGYGRDESIAVNIASNRALTERTRLRLRASVNSARPNLRNQLAGSTSSSLDDSDVALPEPIDLDPTIIGTAGRTTSIATYASIDHELSPTDGLEVQSSFRKNYNNNSSAVDYTDVLFNLGYSRLLSPRTALKVRGRWSLTNYEEPTGDTVNLFGDANVYGLIGLIQHSLSSQWALQAAIGANLVKQDFGAAGSNTDFLFVTDLSLCRSGLQTNFCITGSRSAQPTAQNGVSNLTSIAATYEFRLSADDTLSASAYFGRSERIRANLFTNESRSDDVMGVSARFRHNLSDRASLVIQTSYSDVERAERNSAADYSISLGISLRLGSMY